MTKAKHSDINHSNVFLVLSLKAKEVKAKINNWDLIRLERFCKPKKTIGKRNKQPNPKMGRRPK